MTLWLDNQLPPALAAWTGTTLAVGQFGSGQLTHPEWRRKLGIMPGFNWDKAWRLIGESTREIGILMVVSVPLESAFQSPRPGPLAVIGLMLAGALLVVTGIPLETEELMTFAEHWLLTFAAGLLLSVSGLFLRSVVRRSRSRQRMPNHAPVG